jgi:chaperonin GroES
MDIRPTFDRVLIRRESLQAKDSLIQLPEEVESRNRPARGTIVALGPTCGYLDDETRVVRQDLKVGDRVIFGRYAGTEIEHGKEKLWLVSDRDVLAVVGGEA